MEHRHTYAVKQSSRGNQTAALILADEKPYVLFYVTKCVAADCAACLN
jgi:hypothetical protein